MARVHKLVRPLDPASDHTQGAPTAGVNLVVYMDYECPYSEKANGIIEAVLLHFGAQIHLAVRPFPLPKHPHAMVAAEAAEAAAAQGRFWEMHTLLFEHQDALGVENLLSYAYELRLDIPKFTEDLKGAIYRPFIEEQVRLAKRSGVNSTPTFFINNIRYDGEWDRRSLVTALEQAALHSPRSFHDLEERPFLER